MAAMIASSVRPFGNLFGSSCKNFQTATLIHVNVFCRSISIDTRIEREGAKVDVIFNSGLPFDIAHEYDYAWKPYLWSLQKVFHSTRAKLMAGSQFSGYTLEDMYGLKRMIFILGCHNNVELAFYDHFKKNPTAPVCISTILNDIGTTSEGILQELRRLDDGELLSSMYKRVVSVNAATKRPQPHSEEFVRKFGPLARGPKRALINRLQRPEQSFSHRTTVVPSEIDIYGHISYLHYIKYCYNCASAAFTSTKMKNFTGDFERYKVKEVSSLYLADAGKCDELVVDMWEDEEKTDKLNFVISKAGTDIFHCTVQLYV